MNDFLKWAVPTFLVMVAAAAGWWLLIDYAYPGEALTDGKRYVEERCEGDATFYDVQGQNVLVYACADGKLRTLDYGAKFDPTRIG